MITVGIKTSRKTIQVDFHRNELRFNDFYDLWDYCLRVAHEKQILRIRLIHGRGRDENGLAYIDENIRKRLKNLRGVSSFNPEGGSYGVTLVHLALRRLPIKNRSSHFNALTELCRNLKKEDMVDKVEFEQDQEGRLRKALQMLDSHWDEGVILNLMRDWLQIGRHDLVRSLLDEIEPFAIFYSNSFEVALIGILRELDKVQLEKPQN